MEHSISDSHVNSTSDCVIDDSTTITITNPDDSSNVESSSEHCDMNYSFCDDHFLEDSKRRIEQVFNGLPLPEDQQKVVRSRLVDRYFGLGRFFSNETTPFFCDVKARYEDFHVYEISGYGWGLVNRPQVHLTSLKVEDDDDSKWLPPKTTLDELSWQDSEELVEQISQFSEDKDIPEVLLKIPDITKENRTKLHQYIRQQFTNCESSTINKDSSSFLKLCKKRRKDNEGNQMRSDKRWPPGKPDYYRFVLYKENVDTESAIRAIAGNIDIKRFSYCGTKDRRGITTQYVTGYRIRPTEIFKNAQRHNKKLNGHGRVEVGHFELVDEKVYLGHHCGNAFKIFLRNVRPLDRDKKRFGTQEVFIKNVVHSVRDLSQTGFVNYFGTQRFGSMSMDNHLVGLHILKKDYENAVLLILKPRDESDSRNVTYNQAMNHFKQTRHAEEAFRMLDQRTKASSEGRLLQALAKNNNNYLNSLMTGMSRNMRMLYVHAFQSYIWNLMASYRFFMNGTNVLPGDLVYSKTAKNNSAKLLGLPKVEKTTIDDELAWMNQTQTEMCCETKIVLCDDYDDENPLTDEDILKDKAGIITLDENSVKDYRIEDVYIPIVSYDTKTPKNILGSFLRCTLKSFGLELDDFKNLTKEWCIEGSYRKFVGRMKNFSCLPFLYSKDNAPNMNSDLDIIRSKTQTESMPNDVEEDTKKKLSELAPEEKEVGLFLCFSLDIGQYATVALRELTKLGTLCIENRRFNPKESVEIILRHDRLIKEFEKNHKLLKSNEFDSETEDMIVKTVLDYEKDDPIASFDDLYRNIEHQIKNKSSQSLEADDETLPSKKIKLDE